ncbi:ammonia-forming cytochrome c nitrite reductase [Williamwhitmania taraxaci]|uniref:Cytochrome c-552 n=1 Tax=Williamwhitmania taraxaci TaxID=1640674 RepID=A0A1G6GKH3_9BACT|nr:ammonia-forming cytochrome c nitrite reductase [Williamwhitmania taraxaci]SDB82532.1 respiratory nitrite reductase (cytochrome ammonia-forming) precursor [Williamwhitmania taraxaci]
MKTISDKIKEKPWLGWALFLGTAGVVFLLGMLASSIIERRAEAVFAYTPMVEYPQNEPRNEVWGQNFPREYNTYLKTSDTTFKSKFNGSGKTDMLEAYPELVVLWAGYPFSKEYNQPRGHFYAITDVRNILRTGAPKDDHDGPMPGTCWTCKSPDVPRMMAEIGPTEFYKMKWGALGPQIVNPIGCGDCHDAKNMNLIITRPALIEAFARQGKDITKATHQEMRSLVCAQCHVEYYFKGEGKYLTFPWDKGTSMESMEAYYDSTKFSDWTHSLSRTPMIKAQHPDYELYLTGVHHDRGVSCADCHMPYVNEGGVKFTSHHATSPLQNVANTCQVCHREETQKLVANVYERQAKVAENRVTLEKILARTHFEAKTAWDKGATEKEMAPVLQLIRAAQWRWDFVAASHGGSFHAPLETARIIGHGIEKAQDARIALARVLAVHGVLIEPTMPDISTKAKAQEVIGLDMKSLRKEKQGFLKEVVPGWVQKAKERESTYTVKNM